MPRRKKPKLTIPKLFPRGKKGILYFRMHRKGKDVWVSTKTNKPKDAEKAAVAILEAEEYAEVVRDEKTTHELSQDISEKIITSLNGERPDRPQIADMHVKWKELFTVYSDVNAKTQSFYTTVFERFLCWCEEQKLNYVDQIDTAQALKYSKFLWDSKISPRAFNAHIKHLSRLFSTLDAAYKLPHRDPFSARNVPRKKKSEMNTAGHMALEPDEMEKVIAEASKQGRDYLDLFVIGSQTGMRLADAVMLRWDSLSGNFIEIVPQKTSKTGNTARIPISYMLGQLLMSRSKLNGDNEYVVPDLAEHYQKNPSYIRKKTQRIFEDALGKDKTQKKAGKHRKRNTSIYSFHSFRTTFMSLLASRQVTTRDAMRIMGWESSEMIRVYERELEKAKGDADARTLKLVREIEELHYAVPACPEPEKVLKPTPEILGKLVQSYSNMAIGKIYGISETAVRKWLRKYGIVRGKRVISDISEEDIQKIRNELKS